MFFLKNCVQAASIFASSLETEALLAGTSDIVVVKHRDGTFRTTPFLCCFGPYAVLGKSNHINLYINGSLIPNLEFQLDQHGYSHPMHPGDQQVRTMKLKYGKNSITYQLDKHRINAQIHLFTQADKILISDVDGTLTKNDLGGILSNTFHTDFLHEGYAQLIQKVSSNGYKIVWITMRSLPLYEFSKSTSGTQQESREFFQHNHSNFCLQLRNKL